MTDNFDERLAEVENKYRDELRRADFGEPAVGDVRG